MVFMDAEEEELSEDEGALIVELRDDMLLPFFLEVRGLLSYVYEIEIKGI
jgi:hypothetical protein